MSFTLNATDYVSYLSKTAAHIGECGDYISSLDAATGDGDHWINMNMGLLALVNKGEMLSALPMDACLKEIGMTYMSVVGGSSGVLYGGAYLAASKAVAEQQSVTREQLGDMLFAMAQDMIQRGKSQPGYKTMIDAIYPAALAYQAALAENASDKSLLARVKQAAVDGAEATKAMPAVRGRASYQADKGVGHLDPGAVTMAYQLCDLCDFISETLLAG